MKFIRSRMKITWNKNGPIETKLAIFVSKIDDIGEENNIGTLSKH